MAITVPRPKLNWRERLYLPAIVAGLAITFKHFKNMLLGRTKVTMQYPEQKWDSSLPDHYRGAPALVRDEDGRVRCVACQLCEFICPPRAIKIIPGEIPTADRFAKVEKYPEQFDIDMIRCIFCGMCEEVCPEQAIFLRKDYAITGFTRADMVHDKEKLLGIIQVLVYAGAVMVLFLFIIMLLNIRAEERRRINWVTSAAGIAVALAFLIQTFLVITRFHLAAKTFPPLPSSPIDDVRNVGAALFTNYNLPFQLVGVLVLVATIGVVLLSKREPRS